MPRRLREKPEALIERIVCREETLLRGDTSRYFEGLYPPDGTAAGEASDAGVSDFRASGEEGSDSFDSDFDEGGEASQSTRLPGRAGRARKAAYVRKGFDVRGFGFAEEEDEPERRAARGPPPRRPSKTPQLLHEVFSQGVLLQRAMLHEKENLAAGIGSEVPVEAPVAPVVRMLSPDALYCLRSVWDEERRSSRSLLCFRDEEALARVFPAPTAPRLSLPVRVPDPPSPRAQALRKRVALERVKALALCLNPKKKEKS